MATKKTGSSTKSTSSRSSSGSSSKAKNSSLVEKRKEELKQQAKQRSIKISIVLFAVGVLLLLFVIIGLIRAIMGITEYNLLDYIYQFLCGVFGFSVFFTGPIVIYVAVLIAAEKSRTGIAVKVFQIILGIILLSAAIQIIFVGRVGHPGDDFFGAIATLYTEGMKLMGGGVIGGLPAFLLLLFGHVGAIVIIILIIFVFVMFISRKTLMDFLTAVKKPVQKVADTAKEKHEIRKEELELMRLEKRERERAEFEERERRLQKMRELEAAGKTARKPDLDRDSKEAMKKADDDSNIFINKLNNYNDKPVDKNTDPLYDEDDTPVSTGNGKLPEIVPEDNIHTSAEVLPEVTVSVSKSEIELGGVTTLPDDELPPVPDYPPEPVDPIKAAVSMYVEETAKEDFDPVQENEITPPPAPDYNEEEVAEDDEQYVLPPTTLLDDIVLSKNEVDARAELEQNARTIVDALSSFGVQTKIVGVCRGPSVTRYELQPAAGVKISKITGLADDIALNLAASGIRIEAPIPGKPAVGIEVPNKKVDSVPFRELIESPAIVDNKSKLAAVLGKDISGEIMIADIAQMPHLLVAGTTGSGKSVCVNSIIMSILFRSTPEEVRFIMIDPKAVEFMIYNGIPHLLIPVVTDPKKAAGALAWAVGEMLKRYNLFSEHNVRNLAGYNAIAEKNEELKKLPQIVIFIDELADLIMASKNEVEDSICRLAQMARAAGMHLVIATQRPTVDVVTGLIKANIPSRIALKVSSGVDSRTIIDEQGAEKLLGKGDMLFRSTAMPKPARIQGCWISDREIDRVVTFIKNSFVLDYDEEVIREIDQHAAKVGTNDKKSGGDAVESGDIDVNDEKLEEAIRIVVEAGQASTSALQRRLKLGYGRAARLIDIMEEMGVVGPSEGSNPRQVLMTREQYYERQMNNKE